MKRRAYQTLKSFNTDEVRLSLYVLCVLGYFTLPILCGAGLWVLLDQGAFPADSDSIGIPLGGFMILWMVGLPFALISCALIEGIGKSIDKTSAECDSGPKVVEQNRSSSVK
jgi:hypothetical protein